MENTASMEEIIKAFHNKKIVPYKDTRYLVNPITDHDPETTYAQLNAVVSELSKLANFTKANKVIGEEDRGGFIAALIAFKKKKMLAMAKWSPKGFERKMQIDFRNAYTTGMMHVEGCKKGDRVILVEDIIDTGGTIIAMVQLLKMQKIEITDIICIADKADHDGIEKIENETGIRPKSLITFTCTGAKSKVIAVKGKK